MAVSPNTVMGPYVIAIDHVGVAVADLEAAKAWYLERLGFPCVHEEVNEEQGVREAMLAVGTSGSFIQLLAPLYANSLITRFLDRHGPGVQQVAYRVRDLDGLCAELRDEGRSAALRRAARRHVGVAGELHPSEGRRGGPGRTRRAGRLTRLSRVVTGER